MKIQARHLLFIPAALLLLAACSGGDPGPVTPVGEATATPDPGPTPTSFQPPSPDASPTFTPTAVPLALVVNGESVTLDEFNLALQRFHLGVPEASTEEALERVLADTIHQILLAQAAYERGFTLSEAEFEARLAELTEAAGGPEELAVWMETNLYTPELLEADLRRSTAASWMRDRIYAQVPGSAEQVRARQLRFTTRAEADTVLAQLHAGTDFDLLLAVYDPDGLGELGWFPRGFLFEPAIEEAAFSLSVGDYSGVIETGVGFHIIRVTDAAEDRPLEPEARRVLEARALEDWLAEQRTGADIQVFVP